MKKYQFIKWFPEWCGVGFKIPQAGSGFRLIYDWFLWLGFWEIRKWNNEDNATKTKRYMVHNEISEPS